MTIKSLYARCVYAAIRPLAFRVYTELFTVEKKKKCSKSSLKTGPRTITTTVLVTDV